jgi:hypothetical protein
VGSNDSRIARYVVEYHRVGADTLLQREVFAGMPRIDGVDLRFDALAIAAGMLVLVDIILFEHRQRLRSLWKQGVIA